MYKIYSTSLLRLCGFKIILILTNFIFLFYTNYLNTIRSDLNASVHAVLIPPPRTVRLVPVFFLVFFFFYLPVVN
jgi:hypothetical protein